MFSMFIDVNRKKTIVFCIYYKDNFSWPNLKTTQCVLEINQPPPKV